MVGTRGAEHPVVELAVVLDGIVDVGDLVVDGMLELELELELCMLIELETVLEELAVQS